MSHLGSQLSALVDGQLPPAAAERVLEHVASCAACTEELRAARAARAALWSAGDVPPAPDLTARLLALGSPGEGARPAPRPPAARPVVGFSGSVPLPGHEPLRVPRGCLRGDVVHRRLPRSVVVAAGGCVVAFVGGLAALGGGDAVVPETQRSYALALLAAAPDAPAPEGSSEAPGPAARPELEPGESAGAAAVSRRWPGRAAGALGAGTVEPLADQRTGPSTIGPSAVVTDVSLTGEDAHAEVLTWMADHGWAGPVTLPDSVLVTGLRLDREGSGTLELDLVGPGGPVVVVQEHGRLHPDAVRDMPVVDVGGRSVRVVCNDPWYVVWQSGDSVVTVVADAPTADVQRIVAAHPAGAYDDGVGARLSRGWDALTGSWVP